MKPYIQVKFMNGMVYQVPTAVIVQDRAAYYHERDKDEFPTIEDAIKDSEELFASDTYEIEDWAQNNMNWKDIAPHAKPIRHEPVEEDWMEADFSYHDEAAEIEPLTASDKLLSMPVGFAMIRMAKSGEVCSVSAFTADNEQPFAALAFIQGGPQIVEFFLGGLGRLTETITEAANGSLDAPNHTTEQQQ